MKAQHQSEPDSGLQASHVVLILVAIVFLVFGRALAADFVDWDDNLNVFNNDQIRGFGGGRLRWMLTNLDQAMRYKPLCWLTWGSIYSAQGLAPRGFHFANLFFHTGSALLAFHLTRRLLMGRLAAYVQAGKGTMNAVASLATLAWAVHPLRAEPVAWVTGLPYCQSMFFMLFALLAYYESSQSADARMRRRWYWGSVGAYVLAAFTYPVVAPFPMVLLLMDAAVTKQLPAPGRGWWGHDALRVYRAKIPFVLIAGASLAPTLWARFYDAGVYDSAASLTEFSVLARIMQAFYCWAYFTWRPLLPFDLTPFPITLLDFSPLGFAPLLSAAVMLLVTGMLWAKRRQWPDFFLTWICHLLLLVPVLGLTEKPHYACDRYTYVAAVLWVPWTAVFSLRLMRWQASRSFVGPVAVVVCAALAVGTYRQVGIWHSSHTFFTSILGQLGDSPHRHAIQWRLGVVYYHNGFIERGSELFNSLLGSGYPNASAHATIGDYLLSRGDFERALPHYLELLKTQPGNPDLHAKIGFTFARSGQFQAAADHIEKSLARRPDQPELRQLLRQVIEASNRPPTPAPQ